MSDDTKCPECNGESVEFRGRGQDMQHKVCSLWEEAGHLSKPEILAKIRRVINGVRSSGRYA